MSKEERRSQILEILARDGQITVSDISELFDVSAMTARRDLQELGRNGLLRRVHGGAIISLGRSYEPPYEMRAGHNKGAKAAIGRAAAELVFDGDSIALDVGSTTLEIVPALQGKRNLTILTASLPIAFEISSRLSLNSDVRLILAGGIVRPGELSMVGHIAQRTYSDFFVDKAFIGVGGFSLQDGLTEYNVEDALVKQAFIRGAQRKIVVVDGRKFGRTTFAKIAPLSMIDTVVTDSSAPQKTLDEALEMGIEVILAKPIQDETNQ